MQLHHNWIWSMPYHKCARFDTGEDGSNIFRNVAIGCSKGLSSASLHSPCSNPHRIHLHITRRKCDCLP